MNRARLAMSASYETLAAQRRTDAAPRSAEDDLRPARGVLWSAVLGGVIWLAILYCTWLIVR